MTLSKKQWIYHNTHHMELFVFVDFLGQFQIGRHIHGLFNGQIGVQLIVLHDVGGQFAELADVALFAVHCDGAFDVLCPGIFG
jgi:hypothetical protein